MTISNKANIIVELFLKIKNMGETLSKCCQGTFTGKFSIASTSPIENVSPETESPKMSPKKRIYNNKYEQVGKIGEGGFSKVYLVKHIKTGKLFALKKVSKSKLKSSSNQMTLENVMNEKNILLKVRNPFIVTFSSSFQDEKSLYYLMEYCKGGPITKYLVKQKHFSEPIVQFYTAEIVLALRALHYDYEVIYRDLKPDNVLMTEDGHIKLTDFGLSVIGKKFSMTGCGTPEYIAPEILNHSPHTKMVDYWSLGCMVFLFLFGKFPFYDKNTTLQFEKIKKGHFVFPVSPRVSEEAKDFIRKLLQINPQKRLGFLGIQDLMNHPFFNGINWADINAKKVKPGIQIVEMKLKEEHGEFSFPTNIKVQGFTYERDGSK